MCIRDRNSIKDDDVVICHSNGCLIAWMLLEKGVSPSKVFCIQPALRRDTLWNSPNTKVYCFYNKKDYIVGLGRMWGRFVSVANPFRNRHGWGSAGRHGFTKDSSVINIDTGRKEYPCYAKGHSGFFKSNVIEACSSEIISAMEI